MSFKNGGPYRSHWMTKVELFLKDSSELEKCKVNKQDTISKFSHFAKDLSSNEKANIKLLLYQIDSILSDILNDHTRVNEAQAKAMLDFKLSDN